MAIKKTTGTTGTGTMYFTNYKSYSFTKDLSELKVVYDLVITKGDDEKTLTNLVDAYIVNTSNVLFTRNVQGKFEDGNDSFNYFLNGSSDKLCYTYKGMDELARDTKASNADLLYIPNKLEISDWYNERNAVLRQAVKIENK